MTQIAIFEPSARCGLCVMIVQDPLVRDIVESALVFKGPKGRSGKSIQRELKINPNTWLHHIKSHHYPMSRKNLAKDAVVVLEAQGKLIERETAVKDNFESSWDEIINEGNRLIASGQMRVTSSMLIAAARDKAAYQAKKQDRKLDVAKMMYAYANGGGGAKTDTAGQA